MDGQLQDKISEILSSPEDVKKLMDIVGNLGLSKKPLETEAVEKDEASSSSGQEADQKDISAIERILKTGKDERIQLLTALRPYLKDEKREKIDNILRLLNAAEILISAKNFL